MKNIDKRYVKNGGRILPPLGSKPKTSLYRPPQHKLDCKSLTTKHDYDILVNGSFDLCDGYGCLTYDIIMEMCQMGLKVGFIPARRVERAHLKCHPSFLKCIDLDACAPICLKITPPNANRPSLDHIKPGGIYAIYTMFEATTIPQGWNKYCDDYKIVITPDDFCTELFKREGVNVPVETICPGMNLQKWPFFKRQLPEKTGRPFRFLIYANTQWDNFRKNYQLTLDAFLDVFGDRLDAELVVKLPVEHYPKHLDNYRNVRVATGRYTQRELLNLLYDVDCFLFPSNGEGYGLPPREAMLTGLPVILSDWSSLSKLANVKGLCYPVPVHELQKMTNVLFPGYVGEHAKIRKQDLSETIYRVFSDQEGASKVGMFASNWLRKNEDIKVGVKCLYKRLTSLL